MIFKPEFPKTEGTPTPVSSTSDICMFAKNNGGYPVELIFTARELDDPGIIRIMSEAEVDSALMEAENRRMQPGAGDGSHLIHIRKPKI